MQIKRNIVLISLALILTSACQPLVAPADVPPSETAAMAEMAILIDDCRPFDNTVSIAAGGTFSCGLTTDRAVQCWGDNEFGQLGDGTFDSPTRPTEVTALEDDVSEIVAGGRHICAMNTAGEVACWGINDYGQLGDGTGMNRPKPVDVDGLGDNVVSIRAGSSHTCALTEVGGVKCWGRNAGGQLGDGTEKDSGTPVDVVGLDSGVVKIITGWRHTCAVTEAEGVKCWGRNDHGQLGDGTETNRRTPTSVVGLRSNVTAITAGGRHTCAAIEDGSLKCWGRNTYGQLGDGTKTDRSMPVDVVGLQNDIAALAAGGNHTCALTAEGLVKCWGRGSKGRLGDGTETDRSLPVDVVELGSGVTWIAANGSQTCAVTMTGGVKCWGENEDGQLGDGTMTNRITPINVCR